MSGIRSIRRGKTIVGFPSETSAPIYVDSDDNTLKLIPSGSGSTEVGVPTSPTAALKIARGSQALDGSNPTPVVTGLTTVVSFQLTLQRNTALSAGTAFLTYDAPVGGSVDVYAWLQTGLASTGTETFSWIAIGT